MSSACFRAAEASRSLTSRGGRPARDLSRLCALTSPANASAGPASGCAASDGRGLTRGGGAEDGATQPAVTNDAQARTTVEVFRIGSLPGVDRDGGKPPLG